MAYESAGAWGWVTETHRWAMPHILLPFIAYFYVHNPFLIMTVIYAWESLELIIKSTYGSYQIYLGETTNESIEDSFIGDPLNGALGIIAAMLVVRRYGLKPPRLELLSHGVQIFTLVIHTLWMRAHFGDLPVGYIVTLVTLPLQVYTYWSFWNNWAYGGRLAVFCFIFALAFVARWGELPFVVGGWITLTLGTGVLLAMRPGGRLYQSLLG